LKLLIEWADGQLVAAAGAPVLIGRDPSSDVVIDDSRVSRQHLRLTLMGNNWIAQDLGSSNGTYLAGKLVKEDLVILTCELNIGGTQGPKLRLQVLGEFTHSQLDQDEPDLPSTGLTALTEVSDDDIESALTDSTLRIKLKKRLRIGRDISNDWVIPSLVVSAFHAEIVQNSNRGYDLIDTNSTNGTYINGVKVKRRELTPGDLITIGSETRRFTYEGIEHEHGVEGTAVQVDEVDIQIGKKQLLDNVNLYFGPKTLTAVVGPSGAGKSTLLNVLVGKLKPIAGKITIGSHDLWQDPELVMQKIGYVPQSDILHMQLTVRQALEYAAELRFPKDVSKEDKRARVDEVLEKLELTPRANLQISKLSGGQRKRASIGLELLTKPPVLILDEPTSGLDPGLDAHIMETLRMLADEGQTVIVVTHSVDNLEICDNVVVMAAGGRVAYTGPASTVLSSLKCRNWADVFRLVSNEEQSFFATKQRDRSWTNQNPERTDSPSKVNWIKQMMTLSSRYLKVIAADRLYASLLVGIPILIGLIAFATSGELGLGEGRKTSSGAYYNSEARSTLMVLILGTAFIGLSTSIQELIKERAIFLRERSVGISSSAYLISKVFVLGVITTLQITLFVTLVLFKMPLPPSGIHFYSSFVEILFISIIFGISCMALGLFISSIITSQDQSMPTLVGVTMAQVILSGVIPIASGGIVSLIAPALSSHWIMDSLAVTTRLIKINLIKEQDLLDRWEVTTATFDLGILISVLMALLLISASFVSLKKRN
jgi:ABC-type multidrug transport system ATPase subunit